MKTPPCCYSSMETWQWTICMQSMWPKANCEAARDLKTAIVIGASERIDAGPGNGTLYNSLLTISEDGQIRNHHRKLVPTYTERLVWGNGDGAGLEAVPTSVGHRQDRPRAWGHGGSH